MQQQLAHRLRPPRPPAKTLNFQRESPPSFPHLSPRAPNPVTGKSRGRGRLLRPVAPRSFPEPDGFYSPGSGKQALFSQPNRGSAGQVRELGVAAAGRGGGWQEGGWKVGVGGGAELSQLRRLF